jgi:TRAP-type C4-dicarboxylate transport system permease small subunit
MSLLKEGRMKYFVQILKRISVVERNVGAFFMVGVVIIMCANVAYRAFGGIIPGTFDLVELLIVPAIGFALVTVELQRRHIVVDMVTTHLPKKLQSWMGISVAVIGLLYWAAICWASWKMMLKKMATGEHTQLLQVSVIPFRIIWVFALAWICVMIILNLSKMLKEIGGKK